MDYSNQKPDLKDQKQVKSLKVEVRYRTFYLSINIIKFLELLPKSTSFKIISDQLIRCATSIGANIVEAKASSSKREFLNYFQIALKSANEAKYWLAMLKELLPEKESEIDEFLDELNQIAKIIGTSVLTMKGKTRL